MNELEKPEPGLRDVRYGPHERNVLDFWPAESDTPAPLLAFFHGGGFAAGDKAACPAPLLRRCLQEGISVASSNYRLSHQAPFPAPMLDGARAVQFLRSKAAEWNIDPARVAFCGSSAGAGISLWLAFHNDLAVPDSGDPVERQSTHALAVGTLDGQCSYDPRFVKEHIGGNGRPHPVLPPFFGLTEDEFDTAKAFSVYQDSAPINYLSADAPPVFMAYWRPRVPVPLPADADEGLVIHHPEFGFVLREKMAALGIRCIVKCTDNYDCPVEEMRTLALNDMAHFFVECLLKG